MQQGICRELKPGIRIENEAIVVNPYEGCDYNCAYCRFRSSRYPVKPHPFIAKHLEEVLQENPDLPVIIGAETEPLGPSEVKQGLTLRCMEVLKDQARPYTILTKSDLIAIPKYLSQAYYAEFNQIRPHSHPQIFVPGLLCRSPNLFFYPYGL